MNGASFRDGDRVVVVEATATNIEPRSALYEGLSGTYLAVAGEFDRVKFDDQRTMPASFFELRKA